MSKPRPSYNALINALFVCAVLLRIAIPVGYMPTNVDDGWYLKFCPDGVSASVMGALFGHDHAHHHADEETGFAQCELGNGLSGDALSNLNFDRLQPVENTPSSQPLNEWIPSAASWRDFRPRAPPYSSLI